MSVVEMLATSLKRRDEVPNTELAIQIVAKNDSKAVKELIQLLEHKSKDIQHDCIKVLYEIGERKPKLISSYIENFISLLSNKNNRLQWGAMHALNAATPENPEGIFKALDKIMDAADKGSVITKDNAMEILVKLCSFKQYTGIAFSKMIDQLEVSLTNQLPMYAERALPLINYKNKIPFITVLNSRLKDIYSETKKKRVEKVIRTANKL